MDNTIMMKTKLKKTVYCENMPEKRRYIVLKRNTIDELEEKVEKKFQLGYILYGYPFIMKNKTDDNICQTLILPEKEIIKK